jgi:ketosteroid isomerase-like protein
MSKIWHYLPGSKLPEKEGIVTIALPKPIAEYFAAANTDDADRVAACFAEVAVVRDEGGEFRGRNAIREWAQEARRKYRFAAEAVAAVGSADQTVVTAHLTGDFPGNPVDLNYCFKLTGGKIAELEIG